MTQTFYESGSPASSPVFGYSRRTLREDVGRVFGFKEGTVASGTTSTIVDGTLNRFADDYWNGTQCYIAATTDGAAPQGEHTFVTDFDMSTYTLTVPTFSATVTAGDTYQLYRWVTTVEINSALARAAAGTKIATSITPSTTSLEYNLTCAPYLKREQQLMGVYVRPLNDTSYRRLQITNYHIEDAEGILTLFLPTTLHSTDSLWITYTMDENTFVTDDLSINLPFDLIKARAVCRLIENLLASQDSQGLSHWGQMYQLWKENRKEQEAMYQRPANKVKGFDWERELGEAGTYSRSDLALGFDRIN